MSEADNNSPSPASAASAAAPAASAPVAGSLECKPADMLHTKKSETVSGYIISAKGKNGESLTAFVDGKMTQMGGKLVISEDSIVTIMGAKDVDSNTRIHYDSRTADGNKVNRFLTREQMMDPSEDNFAKDPKMAAKIREAAAAMAGCSEIGPAMEILSEHPSKPMPTPSGGQRPERQKQ